MTAAAPAPPRPGSGAMFDGIARRYDLLNRLTSLGLDVAWRGRLVRAVAGGARALGGLGDPSRAPLVDVATGTADVALALARACPRSRVVGVDPSAGMLARGEAKVRAAGLARRVVLARGDGQRLPLPDGVAAGVTIAFGIRNVPDRPAALREMRRVARPGAALAVLELGEPRRGVLGPLARFHVRSVVPALGAWLSGAREYRYLAASIEAFPEPAAFVEVLAAAGWRDVRVEPLTFDAAHLYVGRA